jgi:hypothetical protein
LDCLVEARDAATLAGIRGNPVGSSLSKHARHKVPGGSERPWSGPGMTFRTRLGTPPVRIPVRVTDGQGMGDRVRLGAVAPISQVNSKCRGGETLTDSDHFNTTPAANLPSFCEFAGCYIGHLSRYARWKGG